MKTGSQRVWDQRGQRQDVVEKTIARRRGPLVEKASSQRKAEAPGLRLSIRRTRTTHVYVRRGWWGQYIAVFVQSKTPSHSKTPSNPFRTLTRKWEVHIFLKKSSLVFYYCVIMYTRRRCPWCNGYRRRKWTRRHEFKPWTRLIAFHIALIPLGKVWILLFSLQLWVNSRTD